MKGRYFFIVCVFLSLMGCNKGSIKGELDTYEKALEHNPQPTYELLKSAKPITKEDKARHAILTIKTKNLGQIPLEGRDTLLILDAIDYYRRQKDVAMQMEGYYLLGSIYRDLGDAPRGVEAFRKVVEIADTTDKSCNYRIMARAEAQRSDLQNFQNVLPKAIESLFRAEYYSWKARDTSYVFDSAFGVIGLYALLNDFQPLEERASLLVDSCLVYGDTTMAIKYTVSYAWFYLQSGHIDEADKMLQLYDRHNGTPYPIYYGTKGELYLAHHQLDSAEWCFRKEAEATDWNNLQSAYRGLKKVYEQKHITDSALKYATLQCNAVDSDYQHKVADDIVRMEQVYNYEAEKEKVRQAEAKQQRLKWMLGMAGMIVAILGIGVFSFFNMFRDRQHRKLLVKETESQRLKAQLEAQEKRLAQEESRRKEAESMVAQMETNIVEINTELLQQKQERDHLQSELNALKSDTIASEGTQHRIKELEAVLKQKDYDIHEVQKEMELKTEELLAQQKQIEQMQSTIEEFREEASSLENLGDGVKQMRQQLENEKHATTRNWEALQKQIVRSYPTFIKSLRQQVRPLIENDLHLAMLIKMGFQPGEIAVLMDKSPSGVSMARSRLYRKCFGVSPQDQQMVDEWILNL